MNGVFCIVREINTEAKGNSEMAYSHSAYPPRSSSWEFAHLLIPVTGHLLTLWKPLQKLDWGFWIK